MFFCWSRFLWVTPETKSTKFGSSYLGKGLLKRDEILQVATAGGGGWYTPPPRLVIFGPECPLGSRNIEECKKNFVMLFSKVILPISMKSGVMGGFRR